MSLDVSVIVSTHQRPARLRALLESAAALVVPAGTSWEFLVIDNGEQSGAQEIARSFAGRLPLRVVREPAAGVCYARNRGVAEAKGLHICWTDDDALLDPLWLSAYVEAFRRHPEAAVFGGRILPELEPPAQAWFARRMYEWPLANLVAYRDFGDKESRITLEGGRIPWGTSYAVRSEEQKRYPYNVGLGFSPRHRRTGEETDVIYRILRDGGSGWWVPDARVRHLIPAERQALAYLDFYYDQAGRTAAFLHDHFPGDNSNAVYGRPAFADMGDAQLRLVAGTARLVSAAAGLAGLEALSLRFRARRFYYLGVVGHRSDAQKAEEAGS